MLLVLTIGGFAICTLTGVAGWQATCWFWRTVLGIPKHPPYIEPGAVTLPHYLDDRITPPI